MPGGRPEKWTKEVLADYAEKFIEWSKLDDSIVLNGFALDVMDVDPAELVGFCEKSPEFSQAMKKAKKRVAMRREAGGFTGKYNASLVAKTMGFYDKEFKAYEKEMKQAERSAQAQSVADGLAEFKKVIDDVQDSKPEKPTKKPVKRAVKKSTKKPVKKRVKKK